MVIFHCYVSSPEGNCSLISNFDLAMEHGPWKPIPSKTMDRFKKEHGYVSLLQGIPT